ncbi:MAG: hypothetical protein CMO55_17645 [Verrucomicrobiales bacterium]|nr:hypothetical protein [Verrucomicrobiales bacterium]
MPTPDSAEHALIFAVKWVILMVEACGVVLVAIGVCLAIFQLIRSLVGRRSADFVETRLTLARFLALALEFQLGADVLATAVSPDWDQIGKLAAVAAIRTVLNYFLSIELKNAGPNPGNSAEGAK